MNFITAEVVLNRKIFVKNNEQFTPVEWEHIFRNYIKRLQNMYLVSQLKLCIHIIEKSIEFGSTRLEIWCENDLDSKPTLFLKFSFYDIGRLNDFKKYLTRINVAFS